MQTANINQKSRTIDPVWHLLAEYSLHEFVGDEEKGDELVDSLLFQTIQELGIPHERFKNIESALTVFVKKSTVHLNRVKSKFSIYIRIFCQKKTIADVNSPKISRSSYTEQTMEPTQIVQNADTKLNEGWGYFLVERGEGFLADSSMGSDHFVDLYLYQEGE